MVSGRLRHFLVKLHLYLALSFGLIFVLLGLTGTAIAWRDELDALLNPDLLRASSPAQLPPDAATVQAVVATLQADQAYGRPNGLAVPLAPDGVFVASYPIKGEKGEKGEKGGEGRSRQVMVDPATLTVRGERIWGEPGLSRRQLMPTLFHLHRYLLSGETGKTVTGVTGMVVLVLVLAGLAIWAPRPRWHALRQSVTVRFGGSWSRLTYTLHRAAGFFLAPVMLCTAFSGWYLNLPKWVTPIVASVMTVSPQARPSSSAPAPGAKPLDAGQIVMAARAAYPDAAVTRLGFPRKPADAWEVRLRQPGELRQDSGATRLWLDAYTGRRLGVRDPHNAAAGDTFINWMYPLHTGKAFGVPGRLFITLFGLTPLLFAVTGVLVWFKRRRGHRRHAQKEQARHVGALPSGLPDPAAGPAAAGGRD